MAPSLDRGLNWTFWIGLCTNFTNNSRCIKLFTGPPLSLRPEKVLVWLLCCQRVRFNLSSKFVLIENKLSVSKCVSFFFFKLRRFIAMIGLDSLFPDFSEFMIASVMKKTYLSKNLDESFAFSKSRNISANAMQMQSLWSTLSKASIDVSKILYFQRKY